MKVLVKRGVFVNVLVTVLVLVVVEVKVFVGGIGVKV